MLLPIISIFIMAAFVYKAQVDNRNKKEESQAESLKSVSQEFKKKEVSLIESLKRKIFQMDNLSSDPPSTLDCLTWTKMNYSTVEHDDEELVIEDDAFNNRQEKFNYFAGNSGVGSWVEETVNFRTGLENIVEFIKKTLKKDKITILDSSFGDFVWMPLFLQGREDVDYTGYDFLPANAETARNTWTNQSWTFETVDLVKDRIKNKFDLLINRHTAIHLGLKDNIQMFHNFHQSGSTFLLTTTYPQLTKNTALNLNDAETTFHEINLAIPPFQFPVPVCQAPDSPVTKGRQYMGLWQMKDLDDFNDKNKEMMKPFEKL